MIQEIKLRAGEYAIKCQMWPEGNDLVIASPYNKALVEEIRMMAGAKYQGYNEQNPRKVWTIHDNLRNRFQLAYLKGEKPYKRYDSDLPTTPFPMRFNKSLGKEVAGFKIQDETTHHILVRKQCIVAEEMGLGKTLSVIRAMELSGLTDFWYVAPKLGIEAVKREFRIWGAKIEPKWLTYEAATKIIQEHVGRPFTPPQFIVFDEASKLKNPQSQRTQACRQIADAVRMEYGEAGYVVLMSGTPAPKSPADWWSLAEVACPGFLKEGDLYKFRKTLGIIVMRSNDETGGSYPQLISWKNDTSLCAICGQKKDHIVHDMEKGMFSEAGEAHEFEQSVNEVARLYRRLKGLVIVGLKKNCLDLPEKQYRIVEIKPARSLLQVAKTLSKTAATTIEGLTLLRELSDGFQYKKVPKGKTKCSRCSGTKKATEYEEIPGTCPTCKDFTDQNVALGKGQYGQTGCPNHLPQRKEIVIDCPNCDVNGQVDTFERTLIEVPCPKYDALEGLLEEVDDVGRVVVFGGFTGTIDRCISTCHKSGWTTIRLDQSKVVLQNPDGSILNEKDYLGLFQDKLNEYPKVAYVATHGSGGMSATLTRSPVVINVSNGFNGADRIQSEDRIHRPGMDVNKGATIIDIIHLPTDNWVLENLKKKKDLQAMTLGEVTNVIESTTAREE